MKNLKLGFSIFGFLVAALQGLPNLLWALRPPVPNALEGNVSSVPFVEHGEHILGVLIVVLLVFMVNRETKHKAVPRGGFTVACFAAIALYWGCWALYYAGIQVNPVIYAMVLLPPVAFFFAGVAEKVYPISAVSAVFLVFHLLVALENFPIFTQMQGG